MSVCKDFLLDLLNDIFHSVLWKKKKKKKKKKSIRIKNLEKVFSKDDKKHIKYYLNNNYHCSITVVRLSVLILYVI